MNLGETIKLLRTEQGLTQPELADKAQIEQSYLSKLENDKGTPSFDIINRIAMALGMNGMELVNRLSHSYIAERLGHIPEIAAEYASIRQKHDAELKRKFTYAALCFMLGAGLIVAGASKMFFSPFAYDYESLGVLAEGELIWLFDDRPLAEIQETSDELHARMQSIRPRIDPDYLLVHSFRGNGFIMQVPGGRRYYRNTGKHDDARWQNSLLMALGSMLVVAGICLVHYVKRFKRYGTA